MQFILDIFMPLRYALVGTKSIFKEIKKLMLFILMYLKKKQKGFHGLPELSPYTEDTQIKMLHGFLSTQGTFYNCQCAELCDAFLAKAGN